MDKILVFGDIHGRTFWKKPAMELVDKVDKIIFLGDYLDSYPDEWSEKHDRWDDLTNFMDIVEFKSEHNDKAVLLLGNHKKNSLKSLTKLFVLLTRNRQTKQG